MTTRFDIEKQDGIMPPKHRQTFREQWEKLPDGGYTFTIEPSGKSFSPSRYKYYFDSVLFEIIRQAGRHFRVTDHNTGEIRQVTDTKEMHQIMKGIFNPVTVQVGRHIMVVPGTTTKLSDREFIGMYMEQILSEYSGPPYLVEFLDYDGWKALRRAGIYRK